MCVGNLQFMSLSSVLKMHQNHLPVQLNGDCHLNSIIPKKAEWSTPLISQKKLLAFSFTLVGWRPSRQSVHPSHGRSAPRRCLVAPSKLRCPPSHQGPDQLGSDSTRPAQLFLGDELVDYDVEMLKNRWTTTKGRAIAAIAIHNFMSSVPNPQNSRGTVIALHVGDAGHRVHQGDGGGRGLLEDGHLERPLGATGNGEIFVPVLGLVDWPMVKLLDLKLWDGFHWPFLYWIYT